MASVEAVVVLAAGEGTRMRSDTPKVLHEMGGRSLLGHVLAAGSAASETEQGVPGEVVVVVGHGRDLLVAHVADRLPAARTAVQDEQLGTGHATQVGLAAVAATEGTVLVLMGDTPLLHAATLRELAAAHAGSAQGGPGHAVTLLTSHPDDPAGYGRLQRDHTGAPLAVVEQRDATPEQLAIREVNAGIYAFDIAWLRGALARLRTDNAQGEAYLTDVVSLAVADARTVGAVPVRDTAQTEGVNDRLQLATLGAELNRRTLHAWMRAGVTVVDPATTWVDVTVTLGRDVRLLPGVQLHRGTSVADGATVGPECTLTDVQVGAGATVTRTHAAGAVVGEGATVGPFAYLRPGTVLEADSRIGTFVETKNTRVGPGAKVPHLSYVGDAEVGEGTNIGAGSITANYDGLTKSRTVIGRHCRTGSDNVFVAPVTVGDGAATGAGTTVRRDVPPGALAVSGGPQRNHEGWTQRKRAGTAAAAAAQQAAGLGQTGTTTSPPADSDVASGQPDEGTHA